MTDFKNKSSVSINHAILLQALLSILLWNLPFYYVLRNSFTVIKQNFDLKTALPLTSQPQTTG